MGQRHNRRRTRPRSRRRMNNNALSRPQQAAPFTPETYHSLVSASKSASPSPPQQHSQAYITPPPGLGFPTLADARFNNGNCHARAPSAQLWHNRYMAWQGRTITSPSTSTSSTSSAGNSSGNGSGSGNIQEGRDEASSKIEAEQCRLFGGEPGDDVALCFRMLEYFGGLDFIK